MSSSYSCKHHSSKHLSCSSGLILMARQTLKKNKQIKKDIKNKIIFPQKWTVPREWAAAGAWILEKFYLSRHVFFDIKHVSVLVTTVKLNILTSGMQTWFTVGWSVPQPVQTLFSWHSSHTFHWVWAVMWSCLFILALIVSWSRGQCLHNGKELWHGVIH